MHIPIIILLYILRIYTTHNNQIKKNKNPVRSVRALITPRASVGIHITHSGRGKLAKSRRHIVVSTKARGNII